MTEILMLVQVDDRSGETVGHALEELVGMGVRNVQLLSSHTKKGRPGMVLLLDLDSELETPVAAYLAAELGAWGYHVLAATHRHFDVTLVERRVTAVCGEQRATLAVRCKLFHQDGVLLRVKLEHADALDLQRFVRASAGVCPLDELRTVVERAVRHNPDEAELEVRL
jgi:uncharacterized protein (DUF111 family)